MLTEEEKKRIRAEEIFRAEVRRELVDLGPRSSHWGTIGRFVNSAFGIWLLSTVVVGMASYLVAQWQQQRQDERIATMQIQKLDQEIGARIDYCAIKMNKSVGFRVYSDALAALNLAPSDGDGGGHPEYRGRPLVSLLRELGERVPVREKAIVSNALELARKLVGFDAQNRERTLRAGAEADGQIDFAQLEEVYAIVNKSFRRTRWPGPELQ